MSGFASCLSGLIEYNAITTARICESSSGDLYIYADNRVLHSAILSGLRFTSPADVAGSLHGFFSFK